MRPARTIARYVAKEVLLYTTLAFLAATPVIVVTASTRACASDAWDTTTPRRGSLIVFGKIFPKFGLLRHSFEQPLIELLCRVDPAVP